MKILMLGWEFPPNISGGLGTACYGIVEGMSTFKNVHLTFVIPTSSHKIKSNNFELLSADKIEIEKSYLNLSQDTIELFKFESRLLPYLWPEPDKIENKTDPQVLDLHNNETLAKTFSFSGKYDAGLFDEIYKYSIVAKTLAKTVEHDVIHAHDWLTFPAAVEAKITSGKPLVLHIHSTDFDRSGGKVNKAIFEIEKKGMEYAEHIITVSNLIKDRVINQYGIPENKVTTVYNAISPKTSQSIKKKSKSTAPKTVTFLGRITIQKGPSYFVELAKKVLSYDENVRFIMAGNGDLMEEIIELVVNSGISDKFLFAGFLVESEVDEMFSKSDIFVMPSVSEPFGIVPLEAMQANVPVIISKQSGVAEIIHSAIKTDFWDINAMADAVVAILKHKTLNKSLVKGANKELSKISWKKTASDIINVYSKISR